MARLNSFGSNRRSGFVRLEWTLVGGGLAAGLVCGAMMIWGQEHSVPASEPETAPPPATVANAGVPEATGDADSQPDPTAKLRNEIRDLRQQLETERMRNELEDLRRELAGVQNRSSVQPARRRSESAGRNSEGVGRAERGETAETRRETTSVGQRTLDVWNEMNKIIVQEAAMRTVPTGGVSANNAADFLDRRIAAGQFATEALRHLDTRNVDRQAVGLLNKLIDWYADGVKVCRQGRKLLEADPKTRRGPKGKAWQKAEKKHNQDVQDVNLLGARVRDKLTKKYRLDFPPLQ